MSTGVYLNNLPHGVPDGLGSKPVVNWINSQDPSIFKVTIDDYNVIGTPKRLDVLHIRSEEKSVTMNFDDEHGWQCLYRDASGKVTKTFTQAPSGQALPEEMKPFIVKALDAVKAAEKEYYDREALKTNAYVDKTAKPHKPIIHGLNELNKLYALAVFPSSPAPPITPPAARAATTAATPAPHHHQQHPHHSLATPS